MDKKIFDKIYAKYCRKDYFGNKEFIRLQIKEARQYNSCDYMSEPGVIKKYLKKQKEQTYSMIEKRIAEYNQGIKYPLREKFTWECIKALGI